MEKDYLFVYGTLRSDTTGRMCRLLARSADFVDDATCQGRLFLVSHYPGLVPSENPEDIVHGEVYRINQPELVLPTLDHYEGCGPEYPQPTEYIRKRADVRLKTGASVRAWMYSYNRPTHTLQRIPSGDFALFGDD